MSRARCGESVTVDLGSAIDGLLEGALADPGLGKISMAESPSLCVGAGGVVRRPGPFATPAERKRGFICAHPGPHRMGYGAPAHSGGGLGNVFQDVASNPIPFFAGAIAAPVLMGFVSRVLARPQAMGTAINPLVTRGVAFGGTIIGAIFTQHPVILGALVGQAVPTLDLFSSWVVEKLVPEAKMPPPAPPVSPSPDVEIPHQAPLADVTPEDIQEMEALKRNLAGIRGSVSHMSGVSDQRRTGYTTGDTFAMRGAPASASVPRRFS